MERLRIGTALVILAGILCALIAAVGALGLYEVSKADDGTSLTVVVVGSILSLLAGIMVSVRMFRHLSRSIAKPLEAVTRAARQFSEGDFEAQLPGCTVGEMHHLVQALADMRESMQARYTGLRARVTRLEDMSNGLPLAVCQMRVFPDGSRVFDFVSDRVAQILGVSVHDLMKDAELRWRYADRSDTESCNCIDEMVRRVRSGERDASCEGVVRVSFGGKTRIVRVVSYAADVAQDDCVTVNAYYQDITEQRRTERLLQDVLDESPSVVFVKDTEGRYILTNRAFDRVLGLPLGGALGKTNAEIFAQEVAERIRAIDARVLATADVQQFEEEIPTPDGSRIMLTLKFPLLDEAGRPYAVGGIANDISNRRAAENALRQSEMYNKILFEESHVPIIVMEPVSGCFVDCNPAAVKIFGYESKEDLIGKTSLAVSATRQANGVDSATALARRKRERLNKHNAVFEWRHQRPSGEVWDAIVHTTQFVHGNELLLQATLEDITVRKVAEAAIENARREAEEAARVKSEFLATMSHEIRTPLNAILGNLELLARSEMSDLQRNRLLTITDSSRTLREIIDDILDFSKIESGQLRLEEIPFDVVETVEQVAAMFALAARAKGLALYYRVAPGLTRRYRGDPLRIRQVLVNLVSNAIKFTESGAVTIEVRSAGNPVNPSPVVISVKDTGIGIPLQFRGELFEPFRQADSTITRRFGGSGLGLALCKRLTALMGGFISVSSEPGTGSLFRVTLPLHVDPAGITHEPKWAHGTRVAFAAAASEWRSAVVPHLLEWGLSVTCIESKDDWVALNAPLIIYGKPNPSDVEVAKAAFSRVPWSIRADEDGPRSPALVDNYVSVSCYSIVGLRRAIDGALHGCVPRGGFALAHREQLRIPAIKQPFRVLVAEDHPASRTLIADQLEVLGYSADLVENGRQALELCRRVLYDMVFTDLSMPKLDGYGLASRLRAQGLAIPIVAITAHATASELERCQSMGIDDVLLKPVSLKDMQEMLRLHMQGRDASCAFAGTVSDSDAVHRPVPQSFYDAMSTASLRSLSIIREALADADLESVKRELHSMKGAFLMAQRPDVTQACRRLEEYVRRGESRSLARDFKQFESLVLDALKISARPC